ncbi:MAG: 2OG-Fe(II) oxygenase family protein [Acidimicrobiia bacterium]
MTPLVDLGAAGSGAALVDALRGHGHAALRGHGIGSALIDEMRAVSLEFFALPRAEKAAVEYDGVGPWRGWQPVHEGSAIYGGDTRPTELLERLEENLCPSQGGIDAPTNRWPTAPRSLRGVWATYHDAAFALTTRLMGLLAAALEVDDPSLDRWCTEQWSNLVVNHFPPLAGEPAPGRVRVLPHTDHGGLTLLCADDLPGGLEVGYPDDRWEQVDAPADAVLVQAGDLLERWSGGRVRATPHRVVNPPVAAGAAGRRTSIVYFHHPRIDHVVAPVTGDRAAYAPVAAGSWFEVRQDSYRRGEASLL